MPCVDITPMGVVETARCIRKIQTILNAGGADVNYEDFINEQTIHVSQAAWFSRSIDCQNLTGKKSSCLRRCDSCSRHYQDSHAGNGDSCRLGGDFLQA